MQPQVYTVAQLLAPSRLRRNGCGPSPGRQWPRITRRLWQILYEIRKVMFWKTKTLAEMSPEEWEQLCDGCGRCCLVKLEDVDTGELHYTDVVCSLLDLGICRCTDYENRSERVPDCVRLTPQSISDLDWMPPTCAYRLINENKDLQWWHPLVSGTTASVREAGISVLGRVISEDYVADDELEDRCVTWPLSQPPAGSGGEGD